MGRNGQPELKLRYFSGSALLHIWYNFGKCRFHEKRAGC